MKDEYKDKDSSNILKESNKYRNLIDSSNDRFSQKKSNYFF
jgi:hypothetical protein